MMARKLTITIFALAVVAVWYGIDTWVPRSQFTFWLGYPEYMWLGYSKYRVAEKAGWVDPENCTRIPHRFQTQNREPGYGLRDFDPLSLANHDKARSELRDYVVQKLPFTRNASEWLLSLTGLQFKSREAASLSAYGEYGTTGYRTPEYAFGIEFYNFTGLDYLIGDDNELRKANLDHFAHDRYDVNVVTPWVLVRLAPDHCSGGIQFYYRDRQFLADQANLDAGRAIMPRAVIGGEAWVLKLNTMRTDLGDFLTQKQIDWRSATLDQRRQLMPEIKKLLSAYEPDVSWFGRYLLNTQPEAVMAGNQPGVNVLINQVIAKVLPGHIAMEEAIIDRAFKRVRQDSSNLFVDSILDVRPIYDIEQLRLLPKDAF